MRIYKLTTPNSQDYFLSYADVVKTLEMTWPGQVQCPVSESAITDTTTVFNRVGTSWFMFSVILTSEPHVLAYANTPKKKK